MTRTTFLIAAAVAANLASAHAEDEKPAEGDAAASSNFNLGVPGGPMTAATTPSGFNLAVPTSVPSAPAASGGAFNIPAAPAGETAALQAVPEFGVDGLSGVEQSLPAAPADEDAIVRLDE